VIQRFTQPCGIRHSQLTTVGIDVDHPAIRADTGHPDYSEARPCQRPILALHAAGSLKLARLTPIAA
jgi:hypothetical protein